MTDGISDREVYEALRQYMVNRPDIGWGKVMCDGMLESANPFDRQAARPPRRWFVLLCLVSAFLFGFFSYFNNLL
jgi:hypothetical protein